MESEMDKNPFKGKISFSPRKNSGPENQLISFDVTKKTSFDFTDNFLCEFNGLHLTKNEKLNLTHIDREIIKRYQHVENNAIYELAEKLISAITKSNQERIYVKAEDFGVYICLAAIFSGKLPSNKKICFLLKNTPLAIFPKRLIKKHPGNNLELNFAVTKDSWLCPFKSLYEYLPKREATSVIKAA